MRQALLAEEHVLGAAEPDPLSAELPGLRCVLGHVRVGPDLESSEVVGPDEHRLEVLVDLRRNERHLADEDFTGPAVKRDRVALVDSGAADLRRLRLDVDRDALRAGHARLAHASGDDGRMRRHAAVHREDALRSDHPVDVVRRRLPADEDDRFAGAAAFRRRVCVEDHTAAGRAGRGVQPLRRRLELRVRIDPRMEQLVK